MSEIKGKQGFEAPPLEDLENYLKQGRKSLNQMKEGKPPLKFRQKRSISIKLVGVVAFILVSSSLFIAAPLLSLNFSDNNTPINNPTSTTTSAIQTTSLTTTEITTTQIPISTDDMQNEIAGLEGVLFQMISENHSLITPIMLDGVINFSHAISDQELFDFIWFLSQFDENSDWWELGKELITTRTNIWNDSSVLSNPISSQLKSLRGMLAYPKNEISLEIEARTSFENTCVALWDNITQSYSNQTHFINPSANDSIVIAADQIVFLDILSQITNQQALFNFTQVENLALELITKLTTFISSNKGIPESFTTNLTWLSSIYTYKDQGSLILSLNALQNVFSSISSIEVLILRLIEFNDIFLEEDWSISSQYNDSSLTTNHEFLLIDQAIGVLSNTKLKKRNVANYLVNVIRTNFKSTDSSYFSSIDDHETQYLLDQLYLLLSFEEFLVLETSYQTTGTQPSSATSFLGIISIISLVILIPIKRKYKK